LHRSFQDENALMISLWNRVVSPALAAPLRISVHWDTDPPPALAWMLRNDRLVVALAAATTAVIWYVVEPIVVTHDSFAYLDAAKFIAGVEGGSFAYFRPPLLPLLLAVTGVPSLQTYVWFILTQLVLGIASVMLMHDCLRRISKSLGLVATALYIATFIGFVYSKSIMTEEPICSDGAFASTEDWPICGPARRYGWRKRSLLCSFSPLRERKARMSSLPCCRYWRWRGRGKSRPLRWVWLPIC
jgi:hypothetical protein